ncbi:Uu.00g063710.m01.CDS01 [Anthostomella pinea]|uniref:Uu.00g063710.m01.CDS01 n=1 Tax=Anthostomella pinea TaxID=933095 RepID=A0AAI8YN52_9PEZI|nr:Uu.00g063710.m01.CDS01 [Anthostomella pinea]
MDTGVSIMDFVHRYQQYEIHRDATHEFIKELMIYTDHIESTLRLENNTLRQQMKDLRLDLDDAAKSRRDLQQRLRDAESRMGMATQSTDQLKNHNPYVLVLIDGDGLIFKENLIKQGIEGGRRAANDLRQSIAEQCTSVYETEIIAKVVANFSGLNKAMKRDGSVDSEMDLKDFMMGFNQAKASFDFVDVGHGKERADSKIKETARFHLRNYNCKQILLGISHDAGYAPFLDDMIRDESTRKRITILEGYPTVRDIVSTGVNIIQFPNLFRSEKLIDRSPPSAHAAHVTPSPFPPIGPSPGMSYATITQKASPPPQITLPIPPKTTNTPLRAAKQPPPVAWNPGPRGLDTPLPLNQVALDGIKKRKDSSKLCNNHYLRGPCAKGDECCFEHDYNPSKDEKVAIAFLARLNPCTNGQDCDVDNCIYGHHCPSVINGICTHPYCKFRVDEHPPGTKIRSIKA